MRSHINVPRAVASGMAAVMILSLAACSQIPDVDEAPVSTPQPTEAAATAEPAYDPVLHDYAFTDNLVWDYDKGEYVGEEVLEDSDIEAIEELLLLIDSYDQATSSEEYVTTEYVDSLRPHLTDRLYDVRAEGAEHREKYDLTQDGEVKVQRMLVTYYEADSEAHVSTCRDFSEYGLTSTTSPDKNVTLDFTEDVRQMRAVRSEGRWILLGEQQSDYVCDDIRNA